jgi:hypothetical protein
MRPQRLAGKVLTVYPAKRQVEVTLQDSTVILVSVMGQSPFFKWPSQGETWTIRRQGSSWVLDAPYQTRLETYPIENLDPGEAQIRADKIQLATDQTGVDAVNIPNGGLSASGLDAKGKGVSAGSIQFSPVPASSVENRSLFVDSADGVLKFKDGGGTLHATY